MHWSDMMLYMIATPSQYTKEELKAWKGMLDGNNFMKSGWVHDMKLYEYKRDKSKNFVVMGQVKHSQRATATPLLPWIIASSEGEVLAAHCTCMAGLGEACSHVAALLSCVIKANEARKTLGVEACTSRSCIWLPSFQEVAPAPVEDIKFIGPAGRKQNQQERNEDQIATVPRKRKIQEPTSEEIEVFYSAINRASKKPAILKVTMPYAKSFVPKLCLSEFPKPLLELYNPETLKMNYSELLSECEKIFSSINISQEQITKIEHETRDQSKCKAWFMFRAGRITASKFRAAVTTNKDMPSLSLIKQICYPDAFKFSSESTRWGCSHEKDAIEAYCKKMAHHQNFQVTNAGFFVYSDKPYLGASPDSIVECTCCGKGVLEVKCPFCLKDGLPEENFRSFCCEKKDGMWELKNSHAYFFQIQLQMTVCNVSYGDFMIWTKKDYIIERILRDEQFIASKSDNLEHLFINHILPEIVGKFYTRKPVTNEEGIVGVNKLPDAPSTSATETEEDYSKLWCYCNQPSFGDMVECDNDKCTIQWFHFACLRIRCPPKGKWYCPSCCKLPKFSRKSIKLNKK